MAVSITINETAVVNVPQPSPIGHYRIVALLKHTEFVSNDATTITNVTEFIRYFGNPTDDNYKYWFQIYNFLKYGNSIDVFAPWDENWVIGKVPTNTEYNTIFKTFIDDYIDYSNYDFIIDCQLPADSPDMNYIAGTVEGENIVCITGVWDETRYTFGSEVSDVIDDFGLENIGTYFVNHSISTFIVGNMKTQYDEYNDVHRMVPMFGDITGLFSMNYDTPFLAGFKYGLIKCIDKLLFYPGESSINTLTSAKINPIIYDRDYGSKFLFGDTMAVPDTADFNKAFIKANYNKIVDWLTTSLSNIIVTTTNTKDVYRVVNEYETYLTIMKAKWILDEYTIAYTINNNNIEYTVGLTFPMTIQEQIVNIQIIGM